MTNEALLCETYGIACVLFEPINGNKGRAPIRLNTKRATRVIITRNPLQTLRRS